MTGKIVEGWMLFGCSVTMISLLRLTVDPRSFTKKVNRSEKRLFHRTFVRSFSIFEIEAGT
jgi:hypothetical protein